jgi:ribonuclease HI
VEQDTKNDIVIFTDGSSLGNPGPGGFGTVILFQCTSTVKEIGEYEEMTTNNRMEITAAIEALLAVKDEPGNIKIYSDSNYLINGITKWIRGWEQNSWQTKTKEDVLNKDLWQRLDLLTKERESKGKLSWGKVKGHSDVLGNQRADAIATGYAEQADVIFMHGPLVEYEKTLGGSLLNIPEYKSSGKSSKKAGPAYSYLSLINGQVQKYKTWAECEKKVKGVKGVKYKKTLSATDEENIINDWMNERI